MEQIKNMFEAMASDAGFTRDIFEHVRNGDNGAVVTAAKSKGFDITEAQWQ